MNYQKLQTNKIRISANGHKKKGKNPLRPSVPQLNLVLSSCMA